MEMEDLKKNTTYCNLGETGAPFMARKHTLCWTLKLPGDLCIELDPCRKRDKTLEN
jgi:hypothetical protein